MRFDGPDQITRAAIVQEEQPLTQPKRVIVPSFPLVLNMGGGLADGISQGAILDARKERDNIVEQSRATEKNGQVHTVHTSAFRDTNSRREMPEHAENESPTFLQRGEQEMWGPYEQ